MLIFITGGVRSGKSSFAERTAITLAKEINGQLHYIATGVASDPEMQERVCRHQKDRANGPYLWKTWEKPYLVGKLGSKFSKRDILLLDCVTTLLNNEFYLHEAELDSHVLKGIKDRVLSGIIKLAGCSHSLIVVSNEILFEPCQSPFVLSYQKLLGELHQEIVQRADKAYMVEMGIPILMKGDLS